MPKHGKKFNGAVASFEKDTAYPATEATQMVKDMSFAKFDETVEAVFRLGIDPRNADQLVRGTVALPHGTGKTVRIAVFANGEKQTEAESAGADVVGGNELVTSLAAGGALDFDLAIATPDMMAEVGKLSRVLGPRGLMPNPKAGTVTMDVAKAVEEFKGGKIEYRNDRYGNVAAPVGKVSFESSALYENLSALATEIMRAKPAAAKGTYIKNITLSSTMGPGIKIDLSRVDKLLD